MKNFTSGKPIKLIFLFMMPILFGLLFQQAYSLADTIIIGQQLGTESVAAVGSTASVVSLVINLINGMVSGYAIIVAKNFGAGNHEEMRRTIARMIVFTTVATIIIMVVMILFITPILQLLNTPESIFEEAKVYLQIVTAGFVVVLIYNLESAILRAVGDSVIPLLILVISAILNIGLDLLFVCVFEWGVAGAAFATVLAQLISAIVCLFYLIKRRPFLIVKRSDFCFTTSSTKELLAAGLGMALMYSIVDIGSIVLQNGINGMGDSIIAAHTVARKVICMMMMPFSAGATALVTFCSQNLGAGKYSRIKIGIRDGVLISIIWSTLAIGIIFLGGRGLVQLMIPDADVFVIDTAMDYLKFNVCFFYPLGILLEVRSSLQGLGRGFVPIIASIIEFAWKFITVILLMPILGYFGVILSEPIIWTVCGIMVGVIAIFTFCSFPKSDREVT